MEVDEDDDLIVRFRREDKNSAGNVEDEDTTNWMAVHYEERMGKEKTPKTTNKPRKPRPPKLKLNSQLILGDRGLPLLAKQCKGMKVKPKQGSEGLQLTLLLQMYDSWAKQLVPGHDLDKFYAKVEKLGNERAVKDQTELLIAAKNESDFSAIQRHTSRAEALITQHNRELAGIERDEGEEDDVELEIEEMMEKVEKSSSRNSTSAHKPSAMDHDMNMPEGDFDAPEGFDEDF